MEIPSSIKDIILATLQGRACVEEKQALNEWLKENPTHVEEYENFCSSYYKLKYVGLEKEIDIDERFNKIAKRVVKKRKNNYLIYISSSVAAILILAIGYLSLFNSAQKEIPEEIVAQLPTHWNTNVVLTLGTGENIELEFSNTQSGYKTLHDSTILKILEEKSLDTCEVVIMNKLLVGRGGDYQMILPDGSHMWVNSETEVIFPNVFLDDKREIIVNGEVYLDIKKYDNWPFIVKTSHSETTVKGTSFNLKAYEDENYTQITLVTGKVNVKSGENSEDIEPGHQIMIDNKTSTLLKQEVNTAYFTSWKDGILDFDGMELKDLILILQRWYNVDFEFVNKSACDKMFSGAFKKESGLDFVLIFIEKTSGVNFNMENGIIKIYDKLN